MNHCNTKTLSLHTTHQVNRLALNQAQFIPLVIDHTPWGQSEVTIFIWSTTRMVSGWLLLIMMSPENHCWWQWSPLKKTIVFFFSLSPAVFYFLCLFFFFFFFFFFYILMKTCNAKISDTSSSVYVFVCWLNFPSSFLDEASHSWTSWVNVSSMFSSVNAPKESHLNFESDPPTHLPPKKKKKNSNWPHKQMDHTNVQ